MTSSDADPWDEIPAPRTPGMLRMAPLSCTLQATGASLHRARDASNLRMLVLKLDGESWPGLPSPTMAGIALEQTICGPTSTMITLRLLEAEHLGPFKTLCDDIIGEVLYASDATTARDKFVARTRSWQDLMRRASSPLLSHEQQMGLIGELLVIRDLLQPTLGATRAVSAWTGPMGAPKDFEAGSVWIEGKAFGAAGRRQIRITSEAQLDHSGSEALFLHVTPLTAKMPAASGGGTLPEWINHVRAGLAADDATCLAEFDQAIATLGYDSHHEYQEGWSPGTVATYQVEDAFPRIVPHFYPDGPVNVSYDLPLSAIEDWRVSPQRVQHALKNATGSGKQSS